MVLAVAGSAADYPDTRPKPNDEDTALTKIPRQVKRILVELWALGQLAKSGALRPVTPAQFTAIRHALNRYGPLGAAVTIAAVRDPDGKVLKRELDATSPAEHSI